jgi:hypothetical protein
MKPYLLPLVGVALGAMFACYVFAMLFTTPLAALFPKALLPFGLAAAVSFALSWADPTRWKLLAAAVALPTLLMVALVVAGLGMEGRRDWSWVLIAGAALCVCIVPSWAAQMRRRSSSPDILTPDR